MRKALHRRELAREELFRGDRQTVPGRIQDFPAVRPRRRVPSLACDFKFGALPIPNSRHSISNSQFPYPPNSQFPGELGIRLAQFPEIPTKLCENFEEIAPKKRPEGRPF